MQQAMAMRGTHQHAAAPVRHASTARITQQQAAAAAAGGGRAHQAAASGGGRRLQRAAGGAGAAGAAGAWRGRPYRRRGVERKARGEI